MPRTNRLPLLAVLALLLGGAFIAAFATAAHASSNQITLMQDDSLVLSNPNGTLDIFRSLGVTDVRIFMGWGSIAPSPNSRRQPRFSANSPSGYRAANWAP